MQNRISSSTSLKRNPPNLALVLEDGMVFEGWSFEPNPIHEKAYGEVVFNTSMVGYQEVLSDPSYYGQLVTMTYPHEGNYGTNLNDSESLDGKPKAAGLIVEELVRDPSNYENELGLHDYLLKHGVPYICGIDTRLLTLHLREKGAMRGWILPFSEAKKCDFSKIPSYAAKDLILEVSTKTPYWFSEKGSKTVVALDFGAKRHLLEEIASRDLKMVVLPANASAEEVLSYKPNGLFLTNGPGDPTLATYAVDTVKKLVGKVPMFGVCMGHEILGMALGGKIFKMKFGHRGINQPVQNLETKSVEISSHNHGYGIDAASLPKNVKVTHVCLNDGVCEGLASEEFKCFSVQYHPESAPGPHDSSYLFDSFVDSLT